MNIQQAAEYLGISEEELLKSFMRGIPPGNLAFKDNGVLTWNEDDLLPPPATTDTFQWPGDENEDEAQEEE